MRNVFLILLLIIAQIKVIRTAAQGSGSTVTVSGQVTGVDGLPLSGTTVLAKGSKAVTVTDGQGRFTIRIHMPQDTIQLTHIGFHMRFIPVTKASADLRIALDANTGEIEEVVVNTGYQRYRPNEVNGSVTLIDNRTLNQQTGTNILQRLEGVTSGLSFVANKASGNPQNNTNIMVRGLSTINGPLDPLIVVDNFIFEGGISNINPNDVESISILKDASAASIWGARAGNGVIVITTKKGRFSQPLSIDFNHVTTIAARPDLHGVAQLSSSDYLQLEQDLFNSGYYDDQLSNYPYMAVTEGVEVLLARRDGLITATDSAQRMGALKSIDSRSEYEKDFYRRSVTQQYSLAMKGGSKDLAWLLSGAVDRNLSSLDARLNKINLRFDNSYRPLTDLTINTAVYYTNSTELSGAPEFNTLQVARRMAPYQRFSEDGVPISLSIDYRNAFTDTAGGGRLLDWKYYPLTDYLSDRQQRKREEIIANLGLELRITPSLELTVRYQYQRQQDESRHLRSIESYYTRNLVNLFTELDHATGAANYQLPKGGIISTGSGTVNSQNLRAQLAFNRSLRRHVVSAIAGAEIRDASNSAVNSGFYGYQASPLAVAGSIDYTTYFQTYDGDSRTISAIGYLSATANKAVSIYSNLMYQYDKRISASLSARRDGSNLFGLKTNDQWNPLWSAGAGWTISNEKFYRLTWLPELRLKASLGYSGNVDVTRTALPIAYFFGNRYNAFISARIDAPPNPELRWERAGQLNIGLQFATRRNVISGSVDWYYKKGSDLYGPAALDYTAWGGRATVTKNIANMTGQGVDLVIRTVNVNRRVRWTSQLLVNYNTSRVTAYFDDMSKQISTIIGSGNSINPVIGKPLYAIASYRWGGLNASGLPQGYVNGALSTDYRAIISEAQNSETNIRYMGPAVPVVSGSVFNTVEYRGLFLQANLIYKLGYYFSRPSLSYSGLIDYGSGGFDFEKRWQKPGDEAVTNVPALQFPVDPLVEIFYARSEANVSKADHVRLQFVNLGYNFRVSHGQVTKKHYNMSAYVNLAQLGILWRSNKYGVDPDYPNMIKPPKTISIGFRTSF